MSVHIRFTGKPASGKSLLMAHIRAGLKAAGLHVAEPWGEHTLIVCGENEATIAETLFPGTHDRPAPKHLTASQAGAWRASRRGVRALDRACKRVMDTARLKQAIASGGLDPVKAMRATFGYAVEPHNIREGETLSEYLGRTDPKPEAPKPPPFQPTDWPRLTLWGRWQYPKGEYSGYSTTTFERVSFVVCGGDGFITVYTVEGHKFEAPRNDSSESAYRAWNECKR